MTITALASLIAGCSFLAGLLGALTGIGGGVILVPLLTLLFHIDLRYAIGASLVSVIATSSGSAAAYVREGFTNVRVGILLEVATTIGALVGASLAGVLPTSTISIVFGLVLLFTAYRGLRPRAEHALATTPDRWAARLRLDSEYPTPSGRQHYSVQNVPGGFILMFIAGILSALLGIGSGTGEGPGHGSDDAPAIQGLDDDEQFHDRRYRGRQRGDLPAAGLHRPGCRVSRHAWRAWRAPSSALEFWAARDTSWLRMLFTGIVVILAFEMLYKGATGAL